MYTEIHHNEDVSIIVFMIKTGMTFTKAPFNTEPNFTVRAPPLYSLFS